MKHNYLLFFHRLILLYKGLKGKARIPTDDLIPKNRHCRNQRVRSFTGMDRNGLNYRNGLLYVALSSCNAFYMHRMTY